ncbi:hypothetical protein KIN20_013087 [Parelaphostrongylus tenuis]|uniref:Uncharacterized protein n=1 Tax=Parelaphostrongylus tenuis TaxID=148309 RepID=A0AAD5MX08_PARTN|nr:hypothetical protein KIN20_013087 [Parelaphostrongylus tenuis]
MRNVIVAGRQIGYIWWMFHSLPTELLPGDFFVSLAMCQQCIIVGKDDSFAVAQTEVNVVENGPVAHVIHDVMMWSFEQAS